MTKLTRLSLANRLIVGLGTLAIVIFVTQMWPRIYGKNKLGVPPTKKS